MRTEVLRTTVLRMKILLIGLIVGMIFGGQAFAQKTVKGQISSGEDKSPLVGANVVVKGTEQGTSTDLDGVYVLENVADDAVLEIFYVGFQNQEVSVNGQDVINVRLTPEAVSGDEVVVIGYGTQQRKDITSSIATLDEHAFNKGVTNDFQQLLQARVPGVTVSASNGDLGAEPLIRIRGGTSVSASNGPMIVIDGVPVDNTASTPNFDENNTNTGGQAGDDSPTGGYRENPLASLNPYDIASIDILKDASAAAIYGARGGNGVILITTKSGQSGGPTLNYDVYTSTSSQSKQYDLLDGAGYRNYLSSSKVEQVITRDTLDISSLLGPANVSTNWQDSISQTGMSHNHNLSFSSGAGNTSYFVSLNYLDEEGIIIGSDRQRVSGRLNVKHKMLDNKLRVGLRLNPSYMERNNTPYRQSGGFRGGLFTNLLKYNPTLPVRNDDGTFYEYGSVDIRNPVAMVELIEDKSDNFRVFSNIDAEYDLTSSLTAKVNVGFDRSNASRNIYQPRELPYMRAVGGRADVRTSSRQNLLLESTLNYNTDISDNQRLDVWAGYSYQEFDNTFSGAAAQNFATDAFSFNNLAAGGDFTVRPFSFVSDNHLISFLGRAIYSLNDKYLLNAAVRREGSSRFGDDQKWGLFPSVSLGWRLSQEGFLRNSSLFEDLKLRVSYGITGNQDIGDYNSLVILGPEGNAVLGGVNQTGISPTQLPNENLKWEETSQVNLGLDYSMIQNKVSGSIDVYQKNTKDLLLEVPALQPAVKGTQLNNIGEVKNTGIEISLNTINVASSDFFWRSNLNFASNKNEVVSLRGDEDFIVHARVSGAGLSAVDAQIIRPGSPLGTFFGPRFLGFEDGKEVLTTDENQRNANPGLLGDGRFILGDAQPDFTYGFSSTMVFKSVDLRFFFQGVQGVDILNNTRLEYQRPSNWQQGLNMFAETVEDVENGLGVEEVVAYSDRFIEDGSYLRLQNITLGYTFDTAFFRNLRIYFSADNVFVLTGYTGLDPEVNTFARRSSSEPSSLGIDYTNYPRARTFTVGFNIGLK